MFVLASLVIHHDPESDSEHQNFRPLWQKSNEQLLFQHDLPRPKDQPAKRHIRIKGQNRGPMPSLTDSDFEFLNVRRLFPTIADSNAYFGILDHIHGQNAHARDGMSRFNLSLQSTLWTRARTLLSLDFLRIADFECRITTTTITFIFCTFS